MKNILLIALGLAILGTDKNLPGLIVAADFLFLFTLAGSGLLFCLTLLIRIQRPVPIARLGDIKSDRVYYYPR